MWQGAPPPRRGSHRGLKQQAAAVRAGGRACLVHARLVEPHDGRVRQLVEDLPRRLHAVHVLPAEELGDELWVVHGADHVLEHCEGATRRRTSSGEGQRQQRWWRRGEGSAASVEAGGRRWAEGTKARCSAERSRTAAGRERVY